MTDRAAQAAIGVACPTCRAPAGQNCRTAKRSGYHTPRAQRGLQRAMRDEHRQHERAWRALNRVRHAAAAGRTPAAHDVTAALGSCGCGECRAKTVTLARELAPWL